MDRTPEMEHVAQVQGLFVKHSSQIRGFIISLIPGGSEVDDLLQETFLTVTAKAADFEIGSNFTAWAMTIARFKILEQFRRSKKSELLLGEEVLECLIEEAPERVGDAPNVNALKHCLGSLTPQVQKMLAYRYEKDWKPEQIAEEFGWGANSVYVALSRARSVLKDCIQKRGGSVA